MQEIIKKAITGLEGESAEGKHYDWYHGMNEQEIVCDPIFWQSLQKACDKNGNTDWADEMEITRFGTHKKVKTAWRYNALKFHEINLTEGWDKAVEYLNSLIK